MPMASNTPKEQSTSPLGEDGIVRCHHGEPTVRFTSHTPANPNRDFYKCSRVQPSERCGFWYWADDQIFQPKTRENKPTGTVTSSVKRSDSTDTNMGPSQPVTSPLHGTQSSARPLSHAPGGPCTPLPTPQRHGQPAALPETPVKRKRPDVESDARAGTVFTPKSPSLSADIGSKRARLAYIEAGLRARQEENTRELQHQHQEEETQPEASHHSPRRPRYSFLGLPPTQESMASGSDPSTPKRASSASNVNQQEPTALLTPPQTFQHRSAPTYNPNIPRPEPTTPTRRKGKERAHPQFDRFVQEDHENPFVEGSSSEDITDKDALPVFSSTQQSSLEPLTTAEQINAHVTGISECMQSLNMHFQNFVQMDSVKHIARLERQKKALELGNSTKKRHIDKLSAQIETLTEKLRELKEECRLKDKTIESLQDKIIESASQS